MKESNLSSKYKLKDKVNDLTNQFKSSFMAPDLKTISTIIKPFEDKQKIFCIKHPHIKRGLRVCFNPDCEFKVFCDRCSGTHAFKCSRIKMDTDFNEMEIFDDEEQKQENEQNIESEKIKNKIKNMRDNINKMFDDIEEFLNEKNIINSNVSKMKHFEENHRLYFNKSKQESNL